MNIIPLQACHIEPLSRALYQEWHDFAPRKMAKFGVSEGMILSAATAEGKLRLLDVDAGAQPGDKVG